MPAEQLVQATIEVLRPNAPFDHMEEEALRFLAARLELVYFARESEILGPQSGPVSQLYIIKQGVVRGRPAAAVRSAPEVDIVFGPGECFPIGALIGRRATAYSYTAEEDCFCYRLAEVDFDALRERSARFEHFCSDYLAALVDQSHRVLRSQLGDALADEGRMRAPLRGLVTRPPVSCTPQTPIGDVLKMMRDQHVGSIVVVDEARVPVGIFTQPDVLERVALARAELAAPISSVMTPEPIVLAGEAPVYEAALTMARHGIRHIVLVEDGRLAGVVSERDLFALQRASVRRAADRIASASDKEALAEAAAGILQLTKALFAQGMATEALIQVVTALNDNLTQRVIEVAAQRHALAGRYCWIALGSEGRMEQTLVTDQDNALILDATAGEAREVYLAFADEVNRTLDACGFPLCKGNIMARNPRWCMTLEEWRKTFVDWIRHPQPEALLNAAIFFDLRAIAGDAQLVGALRDGLLAQAKSTPSFLRLMAENALQARPPIGLLRDFVIEDSKAFPGTIDLKKFAIRPVVDAARVWALAHGLAQTGTVPRLRAAGHAGAMPENESSANVEAFNFIQTVRMRHQHLEAPAPGGENRIDPDALNELDRRILKEAFRQVSKLQERLRLDYQL